MSFSVRVYSDQQHLMLNICDADLVGRTVSEGTRRLSISRNYYGEKIVEQQEAETLLRTSSIVNMAGGKTVSLAISLGIGIETGIKRIGGVPFLIVFQM